MTQLPFPPNPPNPPPKVYVRSNATATSRAAAKRALPRAGTNRALLLHLIFTAPHGLTDDEMIVMSGLPHQSVGPRRLDLSEGGWIADSGRKRKTRTGADAIVWIMTQDGLDRLDALDT